MNDPAQDTANEDAGQENQEQKPAVRVGSVGVKRGMSRVFTEDGRSLPVTLVQVQDNRVVSCGEKRVRVSWGSATKNTPKPLRGVCEAAGLEAGRGLVELALAKAEDAEHLQAGTELPVTQFSVGDKVDVTSRSKGKGFAGTVKRWNFHTQDNTHGNSLAHRKPGSIGQCQTPGKVWKGKKMAGHMGSARVTVQNLEVVAVDAESGVVSIRGAVPGAVGAAVVIRPAVKAAGGGS